MEIIQKYEDVIKTQNKRALNYAGKQGQLLKKFKDTERFFEAISQSKPATYLKMGLFKFLKKYPALKSLHYPQTTLRTTLKASKMLCKKNVTLFSLIRFCLSLLFLTFSSNRDFSFAARIFFSF